MRFWVYMLAVLILDLVSKFWASAYLYPGTSKEAIDGFLYFTYVENHGAAFGIMQDQSWFFMLIGIGVVGGLFYYNARYQMPAFMRIIIGVIAGGALGNLIDRFRYGYVIDFLDLGWWPVFNVADIAIVCGGILLFSYIVWEEKSEASNGKNGTNPG